jgi:hypothetical protein
MMVVVVMVVVVVVVVMKIGDDEDGRWPAGGDGEPQSYRRSTAYWLVPVAGCESGSEDRGEMDDARRCPDWALATHDDGRTGRRTKGRTARRAMRALRACAKGRKAVKGRGLL